MKKWISLVSEQEFFVSHLGFPVPAGDYILVIRVTDELAKKVATQTLSFTVH